MKTPLRSFEYMAWAKTVPVGARYDLTQSGMRDTIPATVAESPGDAAGGWSGGLPIAQIGRRDRAAETLDGFTRAVASRYDVEATDVIPTLGASMAILHTLIALVRSGDHVIVERPTYEALYRTPEILGARVSRLPRTFEDGWTVVPERLAQLLTPRTRAVILSNLHNPTGVAIPQTTLHAIAELAARVGAYVLIDEVYLDFDFSLEPTAAVLPACKVAPNCISWSSSTKMFGVSAARAGWIVCTDPEATRALTLAIEYLHVHPPVCSTELGRRVLEQAPDLERAARIKATAGLKTVARWLAAERRLAWVRPGAGLTVLLRLPDRMNDNTFSDHLRERYETQVVPGSMFEASGHIRVSFGLPAGELEQALANVSAALDDLHS